MPKYGFRVILSGLSQASEGLAHSLYDAGCTDTSVGSRHGIVAVRFQRDADSLESAMLDAREQIESAGYQVQRIELDSVQLSGLARIHNAEVVCNHWR